MISKSKNKKYNKYQLLFCSTIFLHSRSVIVFDSRYMCLLCNNPNKKIPTQKRTLLPNLYLYLSLYLYNSIYLSEVWFINQVLFQISEKI